jgi:multiple sugar transport system substrate-binding protein
MGQADAAFFEPILKEYEATNNVKINHVRTSSGKYDEKLQTMVLGGVAPDVFQQTAPEMARYIEKEFIAPLDEAIAKERYDLRDFFPVAVDQYRRGGKLWAIPYGFGSRIIVYNVDAFRESGVSEPSKDWNGNGWTFDELRSAAKKLQRTGDNNQVTRYGFSFQTSQRGLAPFLYSFGGTWTKSTADAYITGLSDPAAIAAFDYIQQLFVHDGLAKIGSHTLVAQGTAAIGQFIPNAVTEMQETAKSDWDIAPWLRGPGGRYTDGGGTGWFLSGKTKHTDEAAKLLMFLAGRDVQMRQMRIGQTAVARRSVATHPDFLRINPPKSIRVLIDAWQNIRYEPSIVTFNEYWDVFQSAYAKLAAGEITSRQLAETVTDLGNPILRKSGKPVD